MRLLAAHSGCQRKGLGVSALGLPSLRDGLLEPLGIPATRRVGKESGTRVSAQLGHADVAVTAKHYAAWCGGAEYRDPLQGRTSCPRTCGRASRPISIPLTSTQEGVDSEEDVDTNLREIAAVGGSGGWTRTNDLRLMKPPL
jgi:hypothetical protein